LARDEHGHIAFFSTAGGVRVTAPGVIDMSTGAFPQTGSNLVPYAWTYGPDAIMYGLRLAGAARAALTLLRPRRRKMSSHGRRYTRLS